MDKLKELLKQAGCSEQLVKEICESFDTHAAELKRTSDEEFKKRLEKAKQVCLEAVEEEKTNLARKVAIFIESKARKIDEAAERARKIEESEAASKLRQVGELLGTCDQNVSGDNRELQATKLAVSRLEKAVQSLKEERNEAIKAANRAHKIAENAIGRSVQLETQMNEEMPEFLKKKAEKAGKSDACKKCQKEKCECPSGAETCKECKKKDCTCESAPVKGQRLDEGRKAPEKIKSTRPTLVESQVRKPEPTKTGQSGDPRMEKIAASLPELI